MSELIIAIDTSEHGVYSICLHGYSNLLDQVNNSISKILPNMIWKKLPKYIQRSISTAKEIRDLFDNISKGIVVFYHRYNPNKISSNLSVSKRWYYGIQVPSKIGNYINNQKLPPHNSLTIHLHENDIETLGSKSDIFLRHLKDSLKNYKVNNVKVIQNSKPLELADIFVNYWLAHQDIFNKPLKINLEI